MRIDVSGTSVTASVTVDFGQYTEQLSGSVDSSGFLAADGTNQTSDLAMRATFTQSGSDILLQNNAALEQIGRQDGSRCAYHFTAKKTS
jgi:hypothetical protein